MSSEGGSLIRFPASHAHARAADNAPQSHVPLPSLRTRATDEVASPPGLSPTHARATDDPGRKYLTIEQERIVREVGRAGGRQDKAARRAGVKRWRVAAWCKATGNPWAQLKNEVKLEQVNARLAAMIANLSPEARARVESICNHRATIDGTTSTDDLDSGH